MDSLGKSNEAHTDRPVAPPAEVELVVARYNENLDWLLCDPHFSGARVSIYNKGPNFVAFSEKILQKNKRFHYEHHQLPNLGREGHTYLHHIIERYDSLSDVTVFLPGSCMNEMKQHNTTTLLAKVRATKDTVIPGKRFDDVKSNLRSFTVGKYQGTSSENQKLNPGNEITPSVVARPFGSWFRHFFGDISVHVVCFTGTFAVSRTHIHNRPRDFYQQLLAALSAPNPEDGHYMERSWVAVFHPVPDKCLMYADDRTVPGERRSGAVGGRTGGAVKVAAPSKVSGLSLASMLQMYGSAKSSAVSTSAQAAPATVGVAGPSVKSSAAPSTAMQRTPQCAGSATETNHEVVVGKKRAREDGGERVMD